MTDTERVSSHEGHRVTIYREPAPDGPWGAFCHACGFDRSGYGSRAVAVKVAAEHEAATACDPGCKGHLTSGRCWVTADLTAKDQSVIVDAQSGLRPDPMTPEALSRLRARGVWPTAPGRTPSGDL